MPAPAGALSHALRCSHRKGVHVRGNVFVTTTAGRQVAVGGGLAMGSFFIRALTAPRARAAAAPSQSRAAPTAAARAQAEADARRAREEAEEEDLAAAAARDLRRFDRELAERERQRQVEPDAVRASMIILTCTGAQLPCRT